MTCMHASAELWVRIALQPYGRTSARAGFRIAVHRCGRKAVGMAVRADGAEAARSYGDVAMRSAAATLFQQSVEQQLRNRVCTELHISGWT